MAKFIVPLDGRIAGVAHTFHGGRGTAEEYVTYNPQEIWSLRRTASVQEVVDEAREAPAQAAATDAKAPAGNEAHVPVRREAEIADLRAKLESMAFHPVLRLASQNGINVPFELLKEQQAYGELRRFARDELGLKFAHVKADELREAIKAAVIDRVMELVR